jgi:hypothetical protein
MNDTLSRIRAEAERARASSEEGKLSSEESAMRRHRAALPLLGAFADVQHNFVKIEVLKRIWPKDYEQRPDRARGLVIARHGGDLHPCGLIFRIPGGFRSFEVQETWNGRLVYISSRETDGSRPQSWQFDTPEPWLDGFYKAMATLLEL